MKIEFVTKSGTTENFKTYVAKDFEEIYGSDTLPGSIKINIIPVF